MPWYICAVTASPPPWHTWAHIETSQRTHPRWRHGGNGVLYKMVSKQLDVPLLPQNGMAGPYVRYEMLFHKPSLRNVMNECYRISYQRVQRFKNYVSSLAQEILSKNAQVDCGKTLRHLFKRAIYKVTFKTLENPCPRALNV